MKKIVIAIICFILSLNISFSQKASIEEFSQRVLEAFKSGDYEEIFKNFYLPSDYTPSEVKSEKYGIVKSLKLFKEKLGELISYKKIEGISGFYVFACIQSGRCDTWINFPGRITKIFYQAEFEEIGKGYVILEIAEKEGKLFIKSFKVALPSSKEGLSIWNDIQNELMNIFKETEEGFKRRGGVE